jgi:hypothetical protein
VEDGDKLSEIVVLLLCRIETKERGRGRGGEGGGQEMKKYTYSLIAFLPPYKRGYHRGGIHYITFVLRLTHKRRP